MKTSKSTARIFILLTLTAAFTSMGNAYAQGGRGGGIALQNLSGKRPVIVESTAASAMTCTFCKSERKIVSVRDNRGRFITAVPTVNHLCPTCKTTSKVVGHGKAKVEKRSHTCAAPAQEANCCAGKVVKL